MDGPLWSFVLDLAPVRRKLGREVTHARDEIERQAQRILDKDRERYRTALAEADQRVGELEQRVAELVAANRGFAAAHRELRGQLEIIQEIERSRREQEAGDARNTTSDLFRCANKECSSLWLLSRRPDGSYTARGMRRKTGKKCPNCAGDDLLPRLAAIKAGVTEPGDRIARPAGDNSRSELDLPVPGADRSARTDLGVRFVAELIQQGPDKAAADTLAHQAGTVLRESADRTTPPTDCAALAAIADGLDRVPGVLRDGFVWCATEIPGRPEFPARVLGQVAGKVALPGALTPLHAMASGIRAVGTLSCVAGDRLGQCRCARHLGADLAETAVAGELRRVLDHVVEGPAGIAREPSTVHDMPAPHDRDWFTARDDWDDISGS